MVIYNFKTSKVHLLSQTTSCSAVVDEQTVMKGGYENDSK